MKKSQLRNIIRESIQDFLRNKELMTDQPSFWDHCVKVQAKICYPQPGEITNAVWSPSKVLLSGVTPQVGDLFKSSANWAGTYNTIWKVIALGNDYSTVNCIDRQKWILPCTSLQVQGCTDPSAWNYNPLANYDDGSCIEGEECSCCRHNPPGSYQSTPVTMPTTVDPTVGCQSLETSGQFYSNGLWVGQPLEYSNCQPIASGLAECYSTIGCTDPTAINFCSHCTQDDGSCGYGREPNIQPIA